MHPHDDEGRGLSRSGTKPNSSKRPPQQSSDNQPGTSRNVDNNLEGRRRKDRDRERPARDNDDTMKDVRNNCKIGASPLMKMKKHTEDENYNKINERAVEPYSQMTK